MSDKFFLALIKTQAAHAQLSRERFQELGLTEGQPKILYRLNRQDGYVQKELAKVCGIKQSTLTVLLGKLEERNFIMKKTAFVSGGKRAYRIYLTDEGKEMAQSVDEIVEELEEKSFSGFSGEEREKLLELLGRAESNLSV